MENTNALAAFTNFFEAVMYVFIFFVIENKLTG